MKETIKLLLTGVFGPYGIKNEYAEGLGMQMELLNNQITREQNIHSIRQHYWTLPLYLLAENINVKSVVLDFPLWDDFVKELEQGYTHVGINFIVPNVLKAKRMAEYIRAHYPEIEIILGGYGTIIPELKSIMPYDALCKGEGVSWLREYFGEDPNAPIVHPIIKNPIMQSVYGFRSVPNSSVIMPGVGCKNACEFCVTSHHFGKKYISLLPSGKDIFKACEKIFQTTGAMEFFIMDENFLKQEKRPQELLKEMEKHGRAFVFEIFSSAEVVQELGVDFLVRLGVKMIWIGVESKKFAHSKLKDIQFKEFVAKLQDHGISVNTSAILFLDHHTEESIQEDIDWVIEMGADMTQFMNYTAYPTTALYQRLEKEDKIKDLPYKYQAGQGELNWKHPHINDPQKHIDYARNAFKKKYKEGGSAVLNMAITAVEGYKNAKKQYARRIEDQRVWNSKSRKYEIIDKKTRNDGTGSDLDPFFKLRLDKMKEIALQMRPVIDVNKVYAPNNKNRKKAFKAEKLYKEIFGKPSMKDKVMSAGLLGMATKAAAKHAVALLKGQESVIMQPPTNRIEYNFQNNGIEKNIVGETSHPIEEKANKKEVKSISERIKQSFGNTINPVELFGEMKKVILDTDRKMDRIFQKLGNYLYYS